MKRGPKPKGPKRAPAVASPSIPDPPPGLDAAARAHWRRLTELLADARLIGQLDRDLLTLYIETWATREQAERELKRRPKKGERGSTGRVIVMTNGCLQINPWHVISSSALKDLKALIPMLGLSPAARMKLAAPEAEKVPDKWKKLESRRTPGTGPSSGSPT